MQVRVRYAPSPTGLQHIGGVRNALFCYFFARSNNGSFILRVEDTDRGRFVQEAMDDLFTTFKWLNAYWDEGPDTGGDYGPYVQSLRKHIYDTHIQSLLDKGEAYYCFCTPERLNEVREQQKKNKSKVIGYDRHCRDIPREEALRRKESGESCVIRFAVPLEGKTVFSDVIMGEITRRNSDVNPDPVLIKADGFPTYHFASVCDDHEMKVSHVIRSQEWIPSGPLHLLLYKGLGWDPPVFCHLPLIMGTDGKKLSKRHGSTSVRDFREQGYLPEALSNYVALLGWSYDDSREFFTRDELCRLFSLDKIGKAPAVFDYKKLTWFNGQYIRQKTDEQLLELVLPFLVKEGVIAPDPDTALREQLLSLMPLIKERLKLLSQAPEMLRFIFIDDIAVEAADLVPKKMEARATVESLVLSRSILESFNEKSDDEIEQDFKDKADAEGYKLGQLLMPLRAAVTGSRVSPPLFASLRVLGLEKALNRVDTAIKILKKEGN